ncbi:unnamed protein product [Closterium sp. NIES-54]
MMFLFLVQIVTLSLKAPPGWKDAAIWKLLDYLTVEADTVVVSIAADSGSEYGSGRTFGRGDKMAVHILCVNFGAEICFGDSSVGLVNGSSGAPLRIETLPQAPRPFGPSAPATAAAATAAPACATMASLRVLVFDHEGRSVQFDTWLDDLQLYLLSDSKDSVSLFDLASAHALYDAVDARHSSPATAALGRLLLPYLFPELSAFATLEDLVSHLCTSDARYRDTVPAEFLNRNQTLMFIALYFIVTRLPESLRSVRDHFLSLDSTSITVDLLEQHLLAAETSALAVGAARGTPRLPFFEGCYPSPLAPSYASAAAADVSVAEDVGAASASAKRRSSKGKGGRGGGGGSGGGGGGSGSGGGGSSGGGGDGGTGGGSGGSGGGGGGSSGSGGSGGGGTGGGRTGPRRGGPGGGQRQQQQRRSETQSLQQLHEWLFQRGMSGELLRSRVAIFDIDFDVILSAMYALSASAEGDCYRCVPPNPGIVAAALGASEFGILPGTAPHEALHTFTLDLGASRCFFRDSTTLTPLLAPVPVRLADPSGGPVVARSSTVLPYPADAMVTTTTPGGQRVSICTCTRMGRHLATFTCRPGSSQYTLATEPPQVAASAQTLLWHHRLGHPSLPRLRGMHSCLLVSGLPRSLPPLLPSPTPPCLPCIEGRQRAAPHSSSFPSSTAPLQTLHMDVRGPARVSAGAIGAGAVDPGARGAGGTVRLRPYFVPLLQQVLGFPSSTSLTPPLLCPPPDQSQPPLLSASPLPAPSPYTEQSGGLTESREPARLVLSRLFALLVAFLVRVLLSRARTLWHSVPLPAPPDSSLREVPDPESDRARAASPIVSHLLATAVTEPSFESAVASALIAELLDFAAAYRLEYATALVADSTSASPPSIGGECALGTDVLEDKQEDCECLAATVPRFASMLLAPEGDSDAPDIPTQRSYAEAITGPYSSQWQAAMDAEMASWKSTGTYVDEVPPPGANIVDGMWIFKMKRPPGSPPAFKARYVA